jgi:hypothetical protein
LVCKGLFVYCTMKKQILSIICIFVCLFTFAQAPERFIKLFHPPPDFNSNSYGIAETSYGYILSGVTYDTLNSQGFYIMTMLGIDSMGNQLWQKKYGNQDFQIGEIFDRDWLKKIGDYYYTVSPVYRPSMNLWNSVFMKFNEQGDTVFMKEYYADSISTNLIAYGFCEAVDKGFVFVGHSFPSAGGYEKVILFKTDSLGNQQWIQKYEDIILEIHVGNNVVQDSVTKRYIIVGIKGTNNPKPFVYITDSLGNMIYQKYFHSPHGGGFGSVKKLADGNFVASGYCYTGNISGPYDLMRSYLVKFDIDGNLIWEKDFGRESIVTDFSSLEILIGDTIIAGGNLDTNYVPGLGLNPFYQLYKIAPNGDSLWCRYFETDTTVNSGRQEIFRQVIHTRDGGFAMTGWIYGPAPQPYILIKVDKNGCVSAGCETVSINDIVYEELEFDIYPNPANEALYVYFADGIIQSYYYEIMDYTGKIILKGKLNENSFSISTISFSPSVYFIRLSRNGQTICSKKFCITH